MVPTILLITKAAEAAEFAGALHSLFSDLRLLQLQDLDDALSPEEQLLRVMPHALVLGTGQLGIDAVAYVQATRLQHPDCVVCLICEPGFAERAQHLYPDQLLVRPVTGEKLLAALRGMLPRGGTPSTYSPNPRAVPRAVMSEGTLPLDETDLLPADAPEKPRSPTPRPEPSVVVSPELLRADELLPDPFALWTDAPEPGPQLGQKVRKSRASGQFDVFVTAAPGPAVAGPGRPAVAVDPSLYEDALAGIDVNSLGKEMPRKGPAAQKVTPPPPPLPTQTGRAAPPPLPGVIQQRAPTPSVPPRPPRPEAVPPPPPKPAPRSSRPLEPEGDLQSHDPPSLVGRLCSTGYSGCLQVVRDGRTDEGPRTAELAQRALYFDRGELVAATSSLAMDSLPELLYHEGRLSREQLRRARQVMDQVPPRVEGGNRILADKLCAEQLLPRTDVLPLLCRHAIEIFYRTLSWDRGRYRLISHRPAEEDVIKPADPVKLLLLEGLRRKAALDLLQKRVGPDTTVLYPVGQGPALLATAGITAAERRALPLLDGRHTLGQVASQSGLAEHATYILAYTLLCLGVLQPQPAVTRSGPQPAVATSAPARGQPQGSPSLPSAAQKHQAEQRAVAEAMSRIRGKYQQVLSGDYFTLLGLPSSASAIDVRRAYESLRSELSGATLPPSSRAELATEIAQIALVLDEACALLSDDDVRASYRAHLLPLPAGRPEAAAPRG